MKKSLLYLTLTATLGLAGAGIVYETAKTEPKQEIKQEKNLENITFEQAQLNSNLRQQYIKGLKKKLQIPESVAEFRYFSDEDYFRRNPKASKEQALATNTTVYPNQIGKQILKSKVYVLDQAFLKYKEERDLIYKITKEEFDHANMFYNGLPEFPLEQFRIPNSKAFNGTLFKLVGELVCHEKMISEIEAETANISDDLARIIATDHVDDYLVLWYIDQIDPKFIHQLKLRFFKKYFKINPNRFFIKEDGEYLLAPNMKLIKLPEEVMNK